MSGNNEIFILADGESRPHADCLAQVISETFEKMGFMEAQAMEASQLPAEALCASLDIQAPVKGSMYFLAPKELAWSIAENIYGEEDTCDELVTDMIAELLNTICGKFVSQVMPNQEFTLSIPQSCQVNSADREDIYSYWYNINNQGAVVILLEER